MRDNDSQAPAAATAARKRALFIDRDGTIIREPADEQIDSLEKLEFMLGAISGLRALAGQGFELVMVSNQDGLGTVAFPEDTFWPAHRKMLDTLRGEGVEFDEVLIDRSFPADNADTRKPRTGLLHKYMDGSYDLAASFVIGDRSTDIELARNLGAQGILLRRPQEAGALLEEAARPALVLVTDNWLEVAEHIRRTRRRAVVARTTAETDIRVEVDLDGHGETHIDTGLKFFDHMLAQLPHHAGISLAACCRGDLEVDEHHTMEDVAIALGEALLQALGDKRGIERYGFVLPMDECRAMVLLDLGGRADFSWNVRFSREYVGDTPTEMFRHVFHSLCVALRCNLHVEAAGENNHHLAEAVFKAFARTLRQAVRQVPFCYTLPSSKGVL